MIQDLNNAYFNLIELFIQQYLINFFTWFTNYILLLQLRNSTRHWSLNEIELISSGWVVDNF